MERKELIELIKKLVAGQKALETENNALKERLEELERKGARSAAPFSKNRPKKDPKTPGRKPGQGSFTNRPEPEPTEPVVDVGVSDKHCSCGAELVHEGVERVSYTRLPKREPIVVAYDVELCRCPQCGKKYRGKHPQVAPDQSGATAHRVHGEVFAMAHLLHYGHGMPQRRVAEAMKSIFGIKLTQSAIAQDALKRAGGELAEVYRELVEHIRRSAVVYTDDTGWRVKGLTAFLMGFDSDLATVYQIRSQHRHEEVHEVIGKDFAGKLSTDRGKSYDAEAMKGVAQNKCSAHLLRNISKLLESQKPQAQTVGLEIAALIRQALELWRMFNRGEMQRCEFDRQGEQLHKSLGHALRPRRLKDPGNRRLVKELRRHYEQGSLLRHLKDPQMEPTNNRAERILRPAVIARKVSQCSKNQAGAEATSVFKSIIETAKKRGLDACKALTDLCAGVNPLAEILQ